MDGGAGQCGRGLPRREIKSLGRLLTPASTALGFKRAAWNELADALRQIAQDSPDNKPDIHFMGTSIYCRWSASDTEWSGRNGANNMDC